VGVWVCGGGGAVSSATGSTALGSFPPTAGSRCSAGSCGERSISCQESVRSEKNVILSGR
jgi:hypothetical protein